MVMGKDDGGQSVTALPSSWTRSNTSINAAPAVLGTHISYTTSPLPKCETPNPPTVPENVAKLISGGDRGDRGGAGAG